MTSFWLQLIGNYRIGALRTRCCSCVGNLEDSGFFGLTSAWFWREDGFGGHIPDKLSSLELCTFNIGSKLRHEAILIMYAAF